jgi:transglutaminase-like putative cysteine protease
VLRHRLRAGTRNTSYRSNARFRSSRIIRIRHLAADISELVITSDLAVEQSAVAWPVFRISPEAHAFPFAYSSDDLDDLGALRIPEHPDPEGRMEAWTRAFVRGMRTDTLSLLKDLNAGILGPVAYRVRDEEGTQTPLETLALASGSCRDIAALFIEAVRHLGFGARAVSGYLFEQQS